MVDDFLDRLEEKKFFNRINCKELILLKNLLDNSFEKYFPSYETFENLINMGVSYPFLRHVKKSKVQRVPNIDSKFEDFFPINRHLAFEMYSSGSTMYFWNLGLYEPLSNLISKKLENRLNSLVNINAYITPPNSQGLEYHYDNYDIIILQIEGEKNWSFNQSTNVREEVLKPGDVLYIPKGLYHKASCEASGSLHLTIGFGFDSEVEKQKEINEFFAHQKLINKPDSVSNISFNHHFFSCTNEYKECINLMLKATLESLLIMKFDLIDSLNGTPISTHEFIAYGIEKESVKNLTLGEFGVYYNLTSIKELIKKKGVLIFLNFETRLHILAKLVDYIKRRFNKHVSFSLLIGDNLDALCDKINFENSYYFLNDGLKSFNFTSIEVLRERAKDIDTKPFSIIEMNEIDLKENQFFLTSHSSCLISRTYYLTFSEHYNKSLRWIDKPIINMNSSFKDELVIIEFHNLGRSLKIPEKIYSTFKMYFNYTKIEIASLSNSSNYNFDLMNTFIGFFLKKGFMILE